jgi:hypothetical protein
VKTTTPILLAALFVFAGAPCYANKTHAPLPEKVLTAKALFIENHGRADIADKAYDELKKWGRFDIVTDRSKADMILVLSVDEGSTTSGTTSVYHPPDDKNWGGTWSHGTTSSSSSSYVHLTLLDSKTGEALYGDTRLWRWRWSNPTRDAVQELRQRIEEQGKESKAK